MRKQFFFSISRTSFTCLSRTARLSWWLIIALCSRHDAGPSSSRDRRFDLISCFCIKCAISYLKNTTIVKWMLNIRYQTWLQTRQFIIVPHPAPLVLLWSLPLGKNYAERAGSSVKTKQVRWKKKKQKRNWSTDPYLWLLNDSASW